MTSAAKTTSAEPARVLLTGFEPFEQDPVNPSWEVARALDGWTCEFGDSDSGTRRQAVIHAVQLPCVFGKALEKLDEALSSIQPELVISLGLGGSRTEITPERVAINVDDARIPDHANRQPVDVPIAADGPAAYFSTLPIKAIVRALRENGVPSSVSNTAGTFVCNHVFFGLMHRLARRGTGERGGFVHLPYLPEQVARLRNVHAPSMALATQIQGMKTLICTALAVRQDVLETGGTLH